MFCPECGGNNDPGATFCESCGKPLPAVKPAQEATHPQSYLTFGDAVIGFFKVIGSFFTLPLQSIMEVDKELRRIGSRKGAFSTEATPTPFLTWVLVAMRMLVPVCAVLWVILFTLLGFAAGQSDSGWGEPVHWWNRMGSHVGSGVGALIVSLIGAFFFLWAANFYLDLLSVFVNINQRVTEISKGVREKGSEAC